MNMYMKVVNGKPNNIPQPCPREATHPTTGKQIVGLHNLTDKQKREYGYYPITDDRPAGTQKSSSYVVEGIIVRKVYVMFSDTELSEQEWTSFREHREKLLPHLNWTQNELTVSGLTAEQRLGMTTFIQALINAPQACATPSLATTIFETAPEWFKNHQTGWINSMLNGDPVAPN